MKLSAELIFPGKLKQEPIIWYICKHFNLTLNILEASFSTETGWAILIFEAEPQVLKEAFGYLNKKGVEIKDLREIG